jgi:hydroxymethylglutaryl-CoA reductase
MSPFLSPDLETFLKKLDALTSDTSPEWGAMNAQQMIEHLSNSMDISTGKLTVQLVIPEEMLAKSVEYLHSDKPFPKGFKIEYAPENPPLRNESLDDAIDELSMKWIEFEEHYEVNPTAKYLQPVYGMLDYTGWLRLHSKHFTHHFAQFGL